jgi:hypothetical protein
MMDEILNAIKEVIEVWGKLSLCLVPTVLAVELVNGLIKKVYPKFNPKTTWKSHGSIVQALPGIIIALIIIRYIELSLKGYQFPNMLVPIIAIVIFLILYNREK